MLWSYNGWSQGGESIIWLAFYGSNLKLCTIYEDLLNNSLMEKKFKKCHPIKHKSLHFIYAMFLYAQVAIPPLCIQGCIITKQGGLWQKGTWPVPVHKIYALPVLI